jgi:hypothetical protein
MPRVGFDPTIAAFERAKTVHALDRAAAVIGHKRPLRARNTHVAMNLTFFSDDAKVVC